MSSSIFASTLLGNCVGADADVERRLASASVLTQMQMQSGIALYLHWRRDAGKGDAALHLRQRHTTMRGRVASLCICISTDVVTSSSRVPPPDSVRGEVTASASIRAPSESSAGSAADASGANRDRERRGEHAAAMSREAALCLPSSTRHVQTSCEALVLIGFNFTPMLSGDSNSGEMQYGLSGLHGLPVNWLGLYSPYPMKKYSIGISIA
ncbi:hypothetical protein B296_00031986 [Ensete ventricosum]|uniref:Uncharacterized protein n=1 Tax=Ensete ventricosum TaxID=4639 RepID=A0A426Z660_ENSVE|nr:hypothetical protein B296_00031986 [Ensete ventricosum]